MKTTKKAGKKKATVIAATLTAPAPTPVATTEAKTEIKKAAPTRALTTIEAKIDVGFGNLLFVRGEGDGLSWERGTPLTCVDAQTWRLSVPTASPLTFKFLINDTVWAKGENLTAAPGKTVETMPSF